jgi:subtilase family serine protease
MAVVRESNETNNTKTAALLITDTPKPDLVISQVSVVLDSSMTGEERKVWLSILSQGSVGEQVKEALSSALPGEELTVSATVLNNGQENAGPFRVGVYLSDDATITTADRPFIDSCEFAGLAPGALESEGNVCTVTFTLPEDLTPGSTVYIGAFADDEFAVEEGNEGNNTNYVEVEVEGPESCEGAFRAALKECHQTEASISECVGQALAAQKECERGL